MLVGLSQEGGPSIQIPSVASVKAGGSQRLVAGQSFVFQLHFDPAPDHYGGGRITYTFKNDHIAGGIGLDESGGQTELHDGQGIYTISLPITDQMNPGKWKLTEVTLGNRAPKPVPVRDNVAFEVPALPRTLIQIEAPKTVTAGQRLVVKVNLVEFPKGLKPECALKLSGFVEQVSPNGRPNPSSFRVPLDQVELKPDQQSYEMSGSFAPDLPSGTWQGTVSLNSYVKPQPGMRPRPGAPWTCRTPPLEGNTQLLLVVSSSATLVTPTSVAVTVNPSQIQLLSGEADRLKAKERDLDEQLRSRDLVANRALLKNSLQEAVTDVDTTEATFKQRGVDPEASRAINIFFDDIRFSYGEALEAMANESAQGTPIGPQLKAVKGFSGGPTVRLTRASSAVLASILHNAKAYDIAVSTKTLTFSLDVFSDPKGAKISYRQRGGNYQFLDHETDWQIENLPRAVYLIRLQKTGYRDEERTFDAVDSTRSSITIPLERERDKR
jgi:hypothetical protein